MKKILFVVVFLGFFITTHVSAKECYYINDNGVVLTNEEYLFISKFYYDGYQQYLSEEEYNMIFSESVLDKDVFSNTIYDSSDDQNIMLLDETTHETSNKILSINSVCDSNCVISVMLSWINMPNVRSYDVIGAYLSGVSLLSNPITNLVSSSGSSSVSNLISYSNGFGVSVKLPSSTSKIVITQTYKVSTGGKVYASYQHATQSVSLETSQKYTISYSGYGNVFLFNTTAIKNYYDGMGGVNIAT